MPILLISNADSEHELTIDFNEGSYILYFGVHHEHYNSKDETDELLRTIDDILNDCKCVISISYNQEEKPHYLGSQLISPEQALNTPVEELFDFIFKIPEFRKKIKRFGGKAHIQFWDPSMDLTIVVEPGKN